MKAKIIITPKKAVVDPQGITVRKALEQPARHIAENAGIDGSVVVNKIQKSKDADPVSFDEWPDVPRNPSSE